MPNSASRFAVTVAVALSFATCLARVDARPLAAFQDPACVLVLGPTPSVAPIAGGTFTVSVLTRHPAGCIWGASSSMPFATATAKMAQNQVTLQLNPNTSAGGTPIVARAVTFTIGNRFVRVVQDGDPAATPWHIGDVFVGAGSDVDSSGVYTTLAPQGHQKLDTGLLLSPAPPVADLLDGAGSYSSGCMVDPTTASGDLFTASWKANTLSIFDGRTGQVRDVFRFVDPNTIHPYDDQHEAEVGVNTRLAAMPRAAGVAALPLAAIGVADDPSTPADEFVTPEIQAFEQVVFAADGQFYVGTQTPPTSMDVPGLGHGYLLRFRYDPLAPPADKLTLTGWWQLDAGAAFSDGHTVATSGVDQFDLSDQGTIFYTSEDAFIRTFNVNVAGGAPAAIRLKDENGQPLQVRSYGIRILPGALDGSGNATGDGTAGFLVATSGHTVFRVDAQGKTVARYAVPNPFALNLTPDAQFFWTADQISGEAYRFHIASGTRERFDPGAPGIFGLCVKREYSAATSRGQCFTLGADGSYSADDTAACRTPTICSAIPGKDIFNQDNADCLDSGFTSPVFENQGPHGEGTVINLDLNRPGIVVRNVLGLGAVQGLQFNAGVVTGTISPSACAPSAAQDTNTPITCVFDQLRVQWLPESETHNAMHWLETPFTWTVIHSNALPRITLVSATPLTRTVLEPATILLKAGDLDSDYILASVTGLPPGLSAPFRTWAGDGWWLNIIGIPAGDPLHGPAYPVRVDVWDCSMDQAENTNLTLRLMKMAGATPADIDAVLRAEVADALERGTCYHAATSLDFTINVVNTPQPLINRPPVCSAATAMPRLLWSPDHKLVPFSIQSVTDPDGDALAIVITSISQNQPVNDKGDGNTGFDATGVGTSSGAVRAERTGNLRVPGDGRLYQVNFTANDGKTAGTCAGTVFIGVPHDKGQRTVPTDSGCRWDSVTGQQLGPCAWLDGPATSLPPGL